MPRVRNLTTPAPEIKQDAAGMFQNPIAGSHYNRGKIGCQDFIEDQDLPHSLASAVEYIVRCRFKGTLKADLLKAIWHVERYIGYIDRSDGLK